MSKDRLTSRELPRRFEFNEHAEVLACPPVTNAFVRLLGQVCAQLLAQLGAEVRYSTAVLTPVVVLRPDLVWQPEESNNNSIWDLLHNAPPLVVEVKVADRRHHLSTVERAQAFLHAGANEVALLTLNRETVFQRTDGTHVESVFGIRFALLR